MTTTRPYLKVIAAETDAHTRALRRLNSAHRNVARVYIFWAAVGGFVAGFAVATTWRIL